MSACCAEIVPGSGTGGGGGSGSTYDPPYVDLRLAPYNVVADDDTPAVALANARAINQAIVDYSGTGACLALPQGDVYVDKIVGHIYSIIFGTGISDLTLMGWGLEATRLIQQGHSVPGEWDAIVIDGASNIELKAFTLLQGIIDVPDPGQQNHLICLFNNQLGGTTAFNHVWNIKLGKCIGDQVRILSDADTDCVEWTWIHDLELDGEGSSIQAWAPDTFYEQFEWVDNGGQMYQCATAGDSGPGPGPTGLGVGIPDPGGSAIWDSDTNLIGARSGIAVQRGFRNLWIWDISIRGCRNSGLDFEPTSTGTAIMERAWMWNFHIDGEAGNVTETCTVSGNSNQQLTNVTCRNFTVRFGSMGVRYTDDLTVENLDIQTDAPTTVAGESLLALRQTNNRLRVIGFKIWRLAGSGTGICIDSDGHIGDLLLQGGDVVQATPTYPVLLNGIPNLIINASSVRYTGVISPAGFAAIAISVVDSNCTPKIANLVVTNSHVLTMRAAVELQVRAPRTLSNVQIVGLACAGECTYGVIIGAGVGAVYDQYPIIQAAEVGAFDLYRIEDAGGGLTITDVYPITAGSRALGTARRLEGQRTPNGNVVGNLGDTYTWKPTTSTSATYVKASETVAGTPDNTGWQLVSGLTLTPAALAAGATQDYNPTNLVSAGFLRIATDAANSELGGLVATNIANDQEIRIVNLGPGTLQLNDADGGSVAANQFALEGAANRLIDVNGIVIVKRDNTLARWLCIG